jgi:SRSO17 transposase
MGRHATGTCEERFEAYIDGLASVIGHADRVRPLHDYCVGLVLPAERKSVEPMAAITAPGRTSAQHQSLLHFVGQGQWSDEKVLAKVRELVLPGIERHGAIRAWIIDDTSFPKQGRHSVGVARQYCGQLGKQDNCQTVVTLSLANDYASLPVAHRLYLPREWVDDSARRAKAGVPEDIGFQTKPQIALDLIRWACAAGLPRGVALLDAGYGVDATLRMGLNDLGIAYVAGVLPNTLAWKPGTRPEPGEGAPKKGRRGDSDILSLKEIALGLKAKAWRTVEWREGTCDVLSSRFARVRVHVAHRHLTADRHAEEWLLVEWPSDEPEPTKY